jgi:hypothetical protein
LADLSYSSLNHPESEDSSQEKRPVRSLVAPTALLLLAAGCASPEIPEKSSSEPRTRPELPPFFLGGIQVNEDDHEHWLDALEGAGMNTISVTDYAHQGDWDTDHMWWDDENPGLVAELRAAKARGLHVVLILRVAIDHAFERNEFLWHGMIMPKNDDLIRSWFEQYTRFTVRWAEIAEREGVDVLMIGSEMNALASTLPLEEIPALEEYFLNEEKQVARREQFLAHEALIEGRHLSMPERDGYPDLVSYIQARIATEQKWASQVVTDAEAVSLERLNQRRELLQEQWTTLIARLREAYSGPLGYAANFDQYHEVGFWPELDMMGINAYFKVRERLLGPDEEDQLAGHLRSGWKAVLDDIATFRATHGLEEKPLIFTEMGYTWRKNSTLEPWADTGFSLVPVTDENDEVAKSTEFTASEETPKEAERRLIVWRDQPEDLNERALAVGALFDAHEGLSQPFLKGILYWKLSTIPSHHDIESFVMLLEQDPPDPMAAQLRRFME